MLWGILRRYLILTVTYTIEVSTKSLTQQAQTIKCAVFGKKRAFWTDKRAKC